MRVDWLTVTAQWVNLLILALLLRRFLYGPIIRAMDRRQQALEARQGAARQQEEEARREADHFRSQTRELSRMRADLLTEAREEAARERARLIADAQQETQTLRRQWQDELERERREFSERLRRELGQWVLASARKAVRDLCGLELEQALLGRFLERLERLPESEKRLLAASGTGVATLASSLPLSHAQREQVTRLLHRELGPALTLRFEALPPGDHGLLLVTSAHTLEWRLESYFETLEHLFDHTLTEAGQAGDPGHAE